MLVDLRAYLENKNENLSPPWPFASHGFQKKKRESLSFLENQEKEKDTRGGGEGG